MKCKGKSVGEAWEIHDDGIKRQRRQYQKDANEAMCRNCTNENKKRRYKNMRNKTK